MATKPYPQVVLLGDSLFQHAVEVLDGFSFQSQLQIHDEEPPDFRGLSTFMLRVPRPAGWYPLSGPPSRWPLSAPPPPPAAAPCRHEPQMPPDDPRRPPSVLPVTDSDPDSSLACDSPSPPLSDRAPVLVPTDLAVSRSSIMGDGRPRETSSPSRSQDSSSSSYSR
ncbi:hypothetical protein HYQ44_016922 [Verticillium longisporum]|nr:hypothetical protein HYQ44_016922 [Verticillium longisporum]